MYFMSMITHTEFSYVERTSPDAAVVSLAEAKFHANITGSGDSGYDSQSDNYLQTLIDAAIDRFERYTGKRIRRTGFTATLDREPLYWTTLNAGGYYEFRLRDVPLQSVEKIYNLNDDDSEDVLASTEYRADKDIGKIISASLPTATGTPATVGSFNIEYISGYATQQSGQANAAILATETSIVVKGLSEAPEAQRGVLTMIATSGVRTAVVFTSWTESGGLYTFAIQAPGVAVAENDVIYVIAPPQDIQAAIYQMAAHWYEHREATANESIQTVPMSAQMIMDKYKTRRL
jgi:uncharacterized phiE125 gp8 family phage protein